MSTPLAIVTAVAPETRAILSALRRPVRLPIPGVRAWSAMAGRRPVSVVQSGVGPARARAALMALLTHPHALVVSAGFAGALVPGAAAGDVVLPGTVVWEGEDAALTGYTVPAAAWAAAQAALPRALASRALHGAVLSSPVVVESVAGKRTAAARSGAVAVEMEAAALIAVAGEHGLDVLVLRTVLDGADVALEGIPPDLDSSWRARARLLGSPAVWPRVAALARQIPHAARALSEAAAAILPAL